MRRLSSIGAAAALAVFAAGCTSTTHIYSAPAQADVIMDHSKSLGQTPIELEESVWLWTNHAITVRKEGYEAQTIQIRSEGINFAYAAVCACTLGLLLPILFVSEYPKQYVVELRATAPEGATSSISEKKAVSFQECGRLRPLPTPPRCARHPSRGRGNSVADGRSEVVS